AAFALRRQNPSERPALRREPIRIRRARDRLTVANGRTDSCGLSEERRGRDQDDLSVRQAQSVFKENRAAEVCFFEGEWIRASLQSLAHASQEGGHRSILPTRGRGF